MSTDIAAIAADVLQRHDAAKELELPLESMDRGDRFYIIMKPCDCEILVAEDLLDREAFQEKSIIRNDHESTEKIVAAIVISANAAPVLARQVQADAKRIAELEAALLEIEQLAHNPADLKPEWCGLPDRWEKLAMYVGSIAIAAIIRTKEQPHDPS